MKSKLVGLLGIPTTDEAIKLCEALFENENFRLCSNIPKYNQTRLTLEDSILDRIFSDECGYCITLFSNEYLQALLTNKHGERSALFHSISTKPNHILPVSLEDSIEFPTWLRIIYQKIDPLKPDTLIDILQDRLKSSEEEVICAGHPEIQEIIRSVYGGEIDVVCDEMNIKADRIGYSIFTINNTLYKTKLNIIHLFRNISIQNTIDDIIKNYRPYLNADNTSILLQPPKTNGNHEQVIQTTKDLSSIQDVKFIDQLIYEQVTALAQEAQLAPSKITDTFISPALVNDPDIPKSEAHADGLTYLKNWFYNKASTNNVMVLKGPGGIGKTTLTRAVASSMMDSSNNFVVYLDANTLIDALSNNWDLAEHFDLFSIFRLFLRSRRIDEIGQERFKWIFDAGRIPIIIDGLDEVISRLPDNISGADFLNSIFSYSQSINNGKVLITCRNQFWEAANTNIRIRSLKQLPFSDTQIDDYMTRRFNGEPIKKSRANVMLSQIRVNQSEVLFPYVVELVCNSIDVENSSFSVNTQIPQEIPSYRQGKFVDRVVNHFCYRETIKYDNSLSVTEQVSCFLHLVIQYKGKIPSTQIEDLLNEALKRTVSDSSVATFTNHPLLKVDDLVSFRFDFLDEYFLVIAIIESLMLKRNLEYESIRYVSKFCQIDSNFLKDLSSRKQELNFDSILQLSEMKQNIEKALDSKNIGDQEKRNITASIFNMGLQILKDSPNSNIGDFTSYLMEFFGNSTDTKKIDEITIANIPDVKQTIKFDFSGLTIDSAYIKGFDGFLYSTFDETTKFSHSTIINMGTKKNFKTTARPENFDANCMIDENTRLCINQGREKSVKKEVMTATQLVSVLRDFRMQGRLNGNRSLETILRNFRSLTGTNSHQYLEKLVEIGIIMRPSPDTVAITDEWIPSVENFLVQGGIDIKIARALENLK